MDLHILHTFVIIKHNYSKVSTMQKLVLHRKNSEFMNQSRKNN